MGHISFISTLHTLHGSQQQLPCGQVSMAASEKGGASRDPARARTTEDRCAEGGAWLAQHPGQLPSLSRKPWRPELGTIGTLGNKEPPDQR